MASQVGPVVAGTDFSEAAGIALAEARRLASLLHTGLHVVHVVDGKPTADWRDEAEAAAWLTAAGLDASELVVRYGSPAVELARYATEVAPTLVVVGSHGLSGYQPLAIGSTAARVSIHARCPVVLIPPRLAYTQDGAEFRWAGREQAAPVGRTEPGM